jgi:hypothetical protein
VFIAATRTHPPHHKTLAVATVFRVSFLLSYLSIPLFCLCNKLVPQWCTIKIKSIIRCHHNLEFYHEFEARVLHFVQIDPIVLKLVYVPALCFWKRRERKHKRKKKKKKKKIKQNLNTEQKFGRSVVLISSVLLVRIAIPTFHSCCLVITIGSRHI